MNTQTVFIVLRVSSADTVQGWQWEVQECSLAEAKTQYARGMIDSYSLQRWEAENRKDMLRRGER